MMVWMDICDAGAELVWGAREDTETLVLLG